MAAYTADGQAVLAQLRVDARTNELKAALEMLAILPINRRIVTADAIQIHREICVPVFEAGGGYIPSVKDNQPPSPRRRPVISCVTRRSRWNSCQPQSENETARPRFRLAVLTMIEYALVP